MGTRGSRRTDSFGNSRCHDSMTCADCRSAAFGCGGSIPSLPTRIISNDGPNGPSSRFQPMRERRLTRVEGRRPLVSRPLAWTDPRLGTSREPQ